MPIIVIGMHRSGTSLTTSILQKNGLFLGEPGTLFGPGKCNTEGFFEFRDIVILNQNMLRCLNANWFNPPKIPIDFNILLDKFGDNARRLLAYFTSQSEEWGFKDPRTTILYPFWAKLLPEHKVVFCVRHPNEVNSSLLARDGMKRNWRHLWLQYMRRGIRYTKNVETFYTFHQDYFTNTEDSIGRLLDFCNLPAKNISVVKSELRHHNARKNQITDDATRLYRRLYLSHHPKPTSS